MRTEPAKHFNLYAKKERNLNKILAIIVAAIFVFAFVFKIVFF